MRNRLIMGALALVATLFVMVPGSASAFWSDEGAGVNTYVIPGHPDMAWDCSAVGCTMVYRDLGPVPAAIVEPFPVVTDEYSETSYYSTPVFEPAPPAFATVWEPAPPAPFAYTAPGFDIWPFGY